MCKTGVIFLRKMCKIYDLFLRKMCKPKYFLIMRTNKAISKIILIFMIFNTFSFISAQDTNTKFDSLANEVNRFSFYKKAKALEMLDSLYQMAYNCPDSSLCIARCLYEEALLNMRQGIANAFLNDKIKKRLCYNNSSLTEQSLLQSALATCFLFEGKYSDAIEILLQALENYKFTGNNRLVAITLNSLGNICFKIGLIDLTNYYYSEAIELTKPEYHEYLGMKINQLRILQQNKDKTTAIDSLLFLIEIAENKKYEDYLPLLYLNIGSCYLDTLPEKALYYFEKMRSLDFDSPSNIAILYGNIGFYYLEKKDYPKAFQNFKNSQEVMEGDNKNFNNLVFLYNQISRLFEEQNMIDSALYYLKKSKELTQQLYSNTISIEAHQKYITTLFEGQKKDLLLSKKENELKNRQNIIVLIISITTILIVLLFLRLAHLQNRRKIVENRELSAIIEHKKDIEKLEKEKFDEKMVKKKFEVL